MYYLLSTNLQPVLDISLADPSVLVQPFAFIPSASGIGSLPSSPAAPKPPLPTPHRHYRYLVDCIVPLLTHLLIDPSIEVRQGALKSMVRVARYLNIGMLSFNVLLLQINKFQPTRSCICCFILIICVDLFTPFL